MDGGAVMANSETTADGCDGGLLRGSQGWSLLG